MHVKEEIRQKKVGMLKKVHCHKNMGSFLSGAEPDVILKRHHENRACARRYWSIHTDSGIS
jgi:hypothetical protein